MALVKITVQVHGCVMNQSRCSSMLCNSSYSRTMGFQDLHLQTTVEISLAHGHLCYGGVLCLLTILEFSCYSQEYKLCLVQKAIFGGIYLANIKP